MSTCLLGSPVRRKGTVASTDADTLDGFDSSEFVLRAGRAGTANDLTIRTDAGSGNLYGNSLAAGGLAVWANSTTTPGPIDIRTSAHATNFARMTMGLFGSNSLHVKSAQGGANGIDGLLVTSSTGAVISGENPGMEFLIYSDTNKIVTGGMYSNSNAAASGSRWSVLARAAGGAGLEGIRIEAYENAHASLSNVTRIVSNKSGGEFRLGTVVNQPLQIITGSAPSADRATFDTNETAGETAMLISEGGNAPTRVSVGAADSGGLGFRLLRIPN